MQGGFISHDVVLAGPCSRGGIQRKSESGGCEREPGGQSTPQCRRRAHARYAALRGISHEVESHNPLQSFRLRNPSEPAQLHVPLCVHATHVPLARHWRATSHAAHPHAAGVPLVRRSRAVPHAARAQLICLPRASCALFTCHSCHKSEWGASGRAPTTLRAARRWGKRRVVDEGPKDDHCTPIHHHARAQAWTRTFHGHGHSRTQATAQTPAKTPGPWPRHRPEHRPGHQRGHDRNTDQAGAQPGHRLEPHKGQATSGATGVAHASAASPSPPHRTRSPAWEVHGGLTPPTSDTTKRSSRTPPRNTAHGHPPAQTLCVVSGGRIPVPRRHDCAVIVLWYDRPLTIAHVMAVLQMHSNCYTRLYYISKPCVQ